MLLPQEGSYTAKLGAMSIAFSPSWRGKEARSLGNLSYSAPHLLEASGILSPI